MGVVIIIIGVIALQTASGAVWWTFARRQHPVSVFEALGMGLALGTFGSMLSAMFLAGTPLDALAWALPAMLTAIVLALAAIRGRIRLSPVGFPGTQALAVIVGLAAGLALLLGNWARVPLDDPGTTSYTDLYFFEALSRGLAQYGPGQSILMIDGSLRYHWFSYAWAGELAQTSVAAPFVTITRVLPLVALIGVSLLAASWAGRLSRVRWVPSLAVLLIVAGGYAGALYGSILNFDSPSQSMTSLWLMGLAIAFLSIVKGHSTRVAGLILIATLSVACTGGKVSHAVVAAGGLGLVAVVGLATRAPWRRDASWGALVAAIAMALTYIWALAGVAIDRNLTEGLSVKASTWQGLDPFVGRLGVALGTAALLLAIAARLGGLGWLLADGRTRLQPDTLFATGAVLVGVIAMLALSEGVNELWFVLAASAPAAVLAARGVGRALRSLAHPRDRLPHPLLWAIAVAVPASAVCLILSRNWGANQAALNWLAPVSVWLLVPLASWAVVVWRRPGRGLMASVIALSVAGLAITSITTRPAAIWTSNRPITTERGEIAPQSGLPGDVSPGAAASPPQPTSSTFSANAAAAAWLVAHSSPTDVVATTDPLSAVVPALTGRQMYLAGDIYQVGLGRADELTTIEHRRLISLGLVGGVTPDSAAQLCDAGVEWVWSSGSPETAGGIGLPIAYSNSSASILTLPPGTCESG